MRSLLRTTACVAVIMPFVLLVAGSAFAVTITSGSVYSSATSGSGIAARNVATAMDDPYCSGTYFVIFGTGFTTDSTVPNATKGAVVSVSIGNVPAAWFNVGSDTVMYALTGKNATTGPIVVTTNAGTFSTDQLPGGRLNSTDTSIQGQKPGIQIVPCVSKPTIVKPTITGFKPPKVKGGKQTQMNGSGFLGTTKVTVGGISAVFAVNQDQNIVLTMPKNAPNGKLTVTVTNSAGTSTAPVKLTKTS